MIVRPGISFPHDLDFDNSVTALWDVIAMPVPALDPDKFLYTATNLMDDAALEHSLTNDMEAEKGASMLTCVDGDNDLSGLDIFSTGLIV